MKIYVQQVCSILFFQSRKMFFITDSQGFVSYFYNHNNNLYNQV